MPRQTVETTIDAMGHRVSLRWWDITGEVSAETLIEEGERRAREMIAQDFLSGGLNHEGDATTARGWWAIL